MGEYKEERRVEKSRIFLVKFKVAPEIIPGIIERIDFIHPEGLLVEGVEP
jgi:hypothetical protein